MKNPSKINSPDQSAAQPDGVLAAELAETQAALAAKETELVQAKEAQLRALSDYSNLQRRTEGERERIAKLATQDLAGDLLDSLDHLAMAAEHLNDSGLNMIVAGLLEKFRTHGLEELDVVGQPFDPNTMEAVETTGEDGIVTKVIQRGYSLHGVVLRVAKVVVG